MSNLFLFQPNKQQQQQQQDNDETLFYESSAGFTEEDEVPSNVVEEFDDDKNDDTFGDVDSSNDDVMAMMMQQTKELEMNKQTTHVKSVHNTPLQKKTMETQPSYNNNDDVLSSILNQIDDDDDEENINQDQAWNVTPQKPQQHQQPQQQQFSNAWANSPFLGNTTFATPQKHTTPYKQATPQHQQPSPYFSPKQQQPQQQPMMHHSPHHHPYGNVPPPAYHPSMSVEDLESSLMQNYNMPPPMGMPMQMDPRVRQMFEQQQQPYPYPPMFNAPMIPQPHPYPPQQQQPMVSPQDKQKSAPVPNMPQPVQVLQRKPTPTSTPEKQPVKEEAEATQSPAQQDSKEDQPKFRNYKVYNTYLFPDANDGRSIPSYGYFPVYKHSFKDAKFMHSEDIEAIIRVQMADLIVSNAYVDDFYYCSFTNKYYYNKRTPQNFVQWVVDSVYEALELPQEDDEYDAPRIFGKIGSQNVRAPRVIVDIDTDSQQVALSQTSLNKTDNVQLSCLIENGLSLLLQVEDLKFVAKNQAKHYSNDLNHKMTENGTAILQMLEIDLNKPSSQQLLYSILSKHKGVKFVSRCLRFLPDKFSVFIAQSLFLNWSDMYKKLSAQDETLRATFFKDFCSALTQFNVKSLCNTLNAVILGSANLDGDKMWSSSEGKEVLNVLLTRASEVNKRQRNNDLRVIFNKLVDATKNNANAKPIIQNIQF